MPLPGIAANGSLDLVQKGLEIAEEEKSWSTMVRVVPEYNGDLSLVGIRNIHDAINGGAEGFISEARKIALCQDQFLKTRLETGGIADGILKAAREERCNLIIMGGRKKSRNLWRRLAGDGILDRVLREAECPVLVVEA